LIWGDRDASVVGTDNDTFVFNFSDVQGSVNDYIVDFGNDVVGNSDRINLVGIGAGITSFSNVGADTVILINLGVAGLASITVINQTVAGITDDIFYL
jgi:hypothetical protein